MFTRFKQKIIMGNMFAEHEFPPVFNNDSKVLILGSFPSVKSRADGFYYAHKSNRFWPVMSSLFSVSLHSIEEKTDFLLSHNIALWDVVAECDIQSSSDSSIRQVRPNDISLILDSSNVENIYVNGSSVQGFTQYQLREVPPRKAKGQPICTKCSSNDSALITFSIKALSLYLSLMHSASIHSLV